MAASVGEFEVLSPPTDGISAVQFAPTEDLLLVSSWDKALRVYDVTANALRMTLTGDAALLDCTFSDAEHAFCASLSGRVFAYVGAARCARARVLACSRAGAGRTWALLVVRRD